MVLLNWQTYADVLQAWCGKTKEEAEVIAEEAVRHRTAEGMTAALRKLVPGLLEDTETPDGKV